RRAGHYPHGYSSRPPGKARCRRRRIRPETPGTGGARAKLRELPVQGWQANLEAGGPICPLLSSSTRMCFVYAYDPGDSHKQRIAQDLIRMALAGDFLVSTQVLAEFAATLLHKMQPAARPEDVTAVLDALGPIRVVVPDGDVVRRAVDVRAEYGVHFYEGMIVAAAERGGCGRIWSEDLNAGQKDSTALTRAYPGAIRGEILFETIHRCDDLRFGCCCLCWAEPARTAIWRDATPGSGRAMRRETAAPSA